MLLDAEGDGEDDVAFLPGLFVLFVYLFVVLFVFKELGMMPYKKRTNTID